MKPHLNKTAQQIIEYLALFAAVVAVVVTFTRPSGPFRNSVNRILHLSTQTINQATDELCTGYNCGARCGNKVCETISGETCGTCPQDCGICGFCGDYICSSDQGEACYNTATGTGCLADCGPCPSPLCGNGAIDGGEQCDGEGTAAQGAIFAGPHSCATGSGEFICRNCAVDNTACSTCGNGALDLGEQCDGGNLNGKSCQTEGFEAGTLYCYPPGSPIQCQFDKTRCTMCGDNIVQDGEMCDGTAFRERGTCELRGKSSGVLLCEPDCRHVDETKCCEPWVAEQCRQTCGTLGECPFGTQCQSRTCNCWSESPSCGMGNPWAPNQCFAIRKCEVSCVDPIGALANWCDPLDKYHGIPDELKNAPLTYWLGGSTACPARPVPYCNVYCPQDNSGKNRMQAAGGCTCISNFDWNAASQSCLCSKPGYVVTGTTDCNGASLDTAISTNKCPDRNFPGVPNGTDSTYTCDRNTDNCYGVATRRCLSGVFQGLSTECTAQCVAANMPVCQVGSVGNSICPVRVFSKVDSGGTSTYNCVPGPLGDLATGTAEWLCNNGNWISMVDQCHLQCAQLSQPVCNAGYCPSVLFPLADNGGTGQVDCNNDGLDTTEGSATRNCTEGSWGGLGSECDVVCPDRLLSTGVGCPQGNFIKKLVGETSDAVPCTGNCTGSGSAKRTCTGTGWGGLDTSCSVVCPTDTLSTGVGCPVGEFAQIAGGSAQTAVCTGICAGSGPAVRQCKADGTWDLALSTSCAVQCSTATLPTGTGCPDGEFTQQSAGSPRNAACGGTCTGTATRMCKADGTWDNLTSSCSVPCSTATLPTGAGCPDAEFTQQNAGSPRNAVCGGSCSGTATRPCLAGGTWGNLSSSCAPP